MNKEDVKQIIKDLFQENYNKYPEDYPLNAEGLVTERAIESLQETATGYYYHRTPEEVDRDKKLDLTLTHYMDWCMEKLTSLIESKQK